MQAVLFLLVFNLNTIYVQPSFSWSRNTDTCSTSRWQGLWLWILECQTPIMSTSILLILCFCRWVQTGLSLIQPPIALNWTDPVGGSPSQKTVYTEPSSVQEAPASDAIVTPPYLSTTSLQAILPGVTTKPASISAIEAPILSITPSPVTLSTPHDPQSGVEAGCIPFACKIIFQVGYPHVNMDGMDLTSYST